MAWPSIIQYRRKGSDKLLDAIPIGVNPDDYERMEYHPGEPERQEEVVKRNGCPCGWPLDPCNPQFAKGKSCGKEQHEMEAQRLQAKIGMERKAEDHERSAAFYRRTAALIKVNEE